VMTRRPSQSSDVMHAATPSKNLFSPNLRFGADASVSATIVESEVEKESLTPVKQPSQQPQISTPHTPIASAKAPEVKSPTATAPAPISLASTAATPTASPAPSVPAASTQAAADENDDDEDVFNPYLFIANLPSHNAMSQKVKICLPPQQSSKKQMITLALDLDETLVHCSIEPIPNPDHIFPVSFNDVLYQVYVRKRPYLDHFLEAIYKNFEVIIS
jgi:NLI interacting factor-like phosphatase